MEIIHDNHAEIFEYRYMIYCRYEENMEEYLEKNFRFCFEPDEKKNIKIAKLHFDMDWYNIICLKTDHEKWNTVIQVYGQRFIEVKKIIKIVKNMLKINKIEYLNYAIRIIQFSQDNTKIRVTLEPFLFFETRD